MVRNETRAPAARYVGQRQPVADDADPVKSGCADNPARLIILDVVQVNTDDEHRLGQLELRHDPACRASWGRFVPSDRLTYLRGHSVTVTITARRPATGTTGTTGTSYTTQFDGQPVFGHILLDRAGCIGASVTVDAAEGGGSATTACMR